MISLDPADPGTLLVLSPHLDDAALSCGGTIARAVAEGWRVKVLVFFAGTPPDESLTPAAREFHNTCGLGDDAIAMRTAEDRAAMSTLSAKLEHLGMLEALYRLRPDGTPVYPRREDLNHPPSGPEPTVVDAIADAIAASVAAHAPRIVLYPLAIGGHVDHLAVHAGAVSVVERTLTNTDWFAYEDIPYVMFPWSAGWDVAVNERWLPTEVAVAAEHWACKIEAIRCYPSQMAAIFENPERWEDDLADYARSASGSDDLVERFWRPRR